MEGNQEITKKKNMPIKLVAGGGGLAGIILLGGALALVTTFAFKRKQQSKPQNINKEDSLNKSKDIKEDHDFLVGEGLSFLVPDSLSPHLNDHHPSSNGTVDTQDELVSKQIILDKNSETDGGNDEETDVPEKTRDHSFCNQSSVITEEFPVVVADSSLPLKLEEVNEKNDSLEEVEVMKVDKETMTANCNQVDGVYNDWQVPLETDAKNQEVLKAAQADDQLGIDGKAHKQGEEYDGNGNITERKETLVVGAQFNQPGNDDDDSHNLGDECGGNGKIIIEKREEPVEAEVIDQTKVYDKPHKGGEECDGDDDDAGIIFEKGEELVGEVVAANGVHLSEEVEAATIYGDQDVPCSHGIIINRNETETCDIKKADLLLPVIDSSSLLKPGDIDLVKDLLVVEDTKILEGDEASEAAVQEDHSKVEDRAHTQLVEANGNNEECYKIYRENTNDKFEEADEISVENDQQKQSCEECQKIHINGDQEYSTGKSLPEINSFRSDGFEVQEFSFPPLDSQTLFKSGKLFKYDSAETTLHVEDINAMEKDGLAEEVIAYQIVLENNPLVQSAENDETQSGDDSGDNAAAKGEETLETGLVDIAQQTKMSEEEDNDDDSINDENAVDIIRRENFKVANNLQLPQKDHDYNDNVKDREEYDKDLEDGNDDEEEDIDTEEEDNVEEVEESSETTGDSSLDSNAEAIWPDESVLEFSQKVKDMQANNQNFKEPKEEDSYVKFNSDKLEDDDDSFETTFRKKLPAEITTMKQPTNSFNKFWFLSFLVPFLLVLWLSLSQISFFSSSHYHLE